MKQFQVFFSTAWHRLAPLCGLLLIILACGGCQTDHRSYEKDRELKGPRGSAPLTVIEFDERGDFWDQKQALHASEMIQHIKDPILITYVHGWRHDARPDDTNLRGFQQMLEELNSKYKNRVCGVYIGWRGASIREEGMLSDAGAIFSFWGRKKVTDQIAGVPLARTLWDLAHVTREEKGGHSILIGHSFGGRIVERTLGPMAIAQMHDGKPMPYDLTFLINPATESLYARQLKQALGNWTAPQPAIVVITSTDDFPNATVWPLSFILPDGLHNRDYTIEPHDGAPFTEPQYSYVKKTVGNDDRQWNRRLDMRSVPAEAATPPGGPPPSTTAQGRFIVRLQGEGKGTSKSCRVETRDSTPGEHQLSMSKGYWVMQVEPTILTHHSNDGEPGGIFSESMKDLMSGIIMQVQAVQKAPPIVPVAKPGLKTKDETNAPRT